MACETPKKRGSPSTDSSCVFSGIQAQWLLTLTVLTLLGDTTYMLYRWLNVSVPSEGINKSTSILTWFIWTVALFEIAHTSVIPDEVPMKSEWWRALVALLNTSACRHCVSSVSVEKRMKVFCSVSRQKTTSVMITAVRTLKNTITVILTHSHYLILHGNVQ